MIEIPFMTVLLTLLRDPGKRHCRSLVQERKCIHGLEDWAPKRVRYVVLGLRFARAVLRDLVFGQIASSTGSMPAHEQVGSAPSILAVSCNPTGGARSARLADRLDFRFPTGAD